MYCRMSTSIGPDSVQTRSDAVGARCDDGTGIEDAVEIAANPREGYLLRARLEQIINMKRELVR